MNSNPSRNLITDLEALVATTATQFTLEGSAPEVAILANAEYNLQRNGEEWGVDYYDLYFQVPSWLYSQIADDIDKYETRILDKARELLKPYPNDDLARVFISPILSADEDWRKKAKNWLEGNGVNNQGRVRSDNIASKQVDGLLFRSENEVLFYRALKSLGVSFAPLPVFIRGGEKYRRIEPDFVIVKNGVVLVVEVDGDTVTMKHQRKRMTGQRCLLMKVYILSEFERRSAKPKIRHLPVQRISYRFLIKLSLQGRYQTPSLQTTVSFSISKATAIA